MGVVLDSVTLATRLAEVFERDVPRLAYEVRLADDGQSLVWIDRGDGGEVRLGSAPEVGVLKRMWTGFLSLLPIEWLL
jgi:putative cardiolipin synthase